MTALRRRVADPLVAILAIALALLMIGCGSTVAPGSPSAPTRPSAELTPVPGGPSGRPPTSPAEPPTTTDVDGFGTIFDALPAAFPRLPGQEPTESSSGPTSGSFAVNMTADAAAFAMAARLKNTGWTADVGSPLEDGTVVLEAARKEAGCKAEVRFTPASGTIIMSVLYGASCPFG